MAKDRVSSHFQLLGGYFSPVSNAYGKSGLAEGHHRVKMVELALEGSDWLMCDSWESLQAEFQTTGAFIRGHSSMT